MQDGIGVCRKDFLKKLINCAAQLFDRLEEFKSTKYSSGSTRPVLNKRTGGNFSEI